MITVVNKLKSFGFIETQKSLPITNCQKFKTHHFEANKDGVKIKAIISKGDVHKYQISISYIPNLNDVRDVLSMIEFSTIKELCFLLMSNCHIRFVCNTF